MDLTPTTLLPQLEDDQRGLLAKQLYSSAKKLTGTALASSARTATTQSANISGTGWKNLVWFLNVTAASGTGGLTLNIRELDPVSGSWFLVYTESTVRTTTGSWCGAVGVGMNSNSSNATLGGLRPCPLTDNLRIEVAHGDASSYTYSVGYCLT